MKKIISIISIITLVFSLSAVYAVDPNDISATSISALDSASGAIIGALQVVATVVAIAMLLFVGIKFMMAAPGEKANLKGALIPYIVGAILIFAAIPLLSMIKNFSSNFS